MKHVLVMLSLAALVSPARAQAGSPAMLLQRFMQAWNTSDPAAISSLFAQDADLIAPDGMFPTGRSAIAAYYAGAFSQGYSGSTLTGKIIQQRMLVPGLTIVDVRFDIVGAHKSDGSMLPVEHGAMAALMRKEPSGWQILAQRERNGNHFIPFRSR